MVDSEPFPALSSAAEQLQHVNGNGNGTSNGTASGAHAHAADGAARRRRKSSVLGGDINAGDTGAPAMASSRVSLDANDVNVQVCRFVFSFPPPRLTTVSLAVC